MKPICVFMIGMSLAFGKVTMGQLITMSNKCYDQVKKGKVQLDSSSYSNALQTFDKVLKDCTAKDGKIEGNIGRARALNGLKRYDEAISNAGTAISTSKNTNVMAYYTRSFAYQKTGKTEEARKDLEMITNLTKKNRDVKSRATMFANLAEIDKAEANYVSAKSNLAEAIALDSANGDFYIQRGDVSMKEKKYDEAFSDYDKAVKHGKNDVNMYSIRSNARIKQMQDKYKTQNGNELAKKMNAGEKKMVCTELTKALSMGLRNIQLDLFSNMICK
jgi:tetratricopeptide (TPR) repeat protein